MQELKKSITLDQTVNLLEKVRQCKPLIHHITNYVTVNDCANITLHTGGLPVMAHAIDEVEEMVAAAGALVLNIGTLEKDQVAAMIKAGQRANKLGIPVLLDPVGVGATKLRTDSAKEILSEVKVTVVKGNYAEIGILAGVGAAIRGVEAEGSSEGIEQVAQDFAAARDTTVVITGVTDTVTSGHKTVTIANGHKYMGQITGTGCMAGSVIGCFLAVEQDPALAAAAALVCYGVAGEAAATRSEVVGPTSFKNAFFDCLYNLKSEQVLKLGKLNVE